MSRILVAEDEVLVRDLIVEELTDAGFDVEAISDGEQALRRLQAGARYDLLLTDIRMPGAIDGWELGRNARQFLPAIQIVYATGYSAQLLALGDNEAFLAKPYRTSELLKLIERMGITARKKA